MLFSSSLLARSIGFVVAGAMLLSCGGMPTHSIVSDVTHGGLLNGDRLVITESRTLASPVQEGTSFVVAANGSGGVAWNWVRRINLGRSELPTTSALGSVADLAGAGRASGPALDAGTGRAYFSVRGKVQLLPAGSVPAGRYILSATLRSSVRTLYVPYAGLSLSQPRTIQSTVSVAFGCNVGNRSRPIVASGGNQTFARTSSGWVSAETSMVTQPVDLSSLCGTDRALFVSFGGGDLLGFQFLDAAVTLSRVN